MGMPNTPPSPTSSQAAFVEGVISADPNAPAAGFISPEGSVYVGVEPSAHPGPGVGGGNPAPAPAPAADPTRVFTQEDIEKARKQEKDKLYADLEEAKATMRELQQKQRERDEAEAAARTAAEEAARLAAEEEMGFKELLAKRDQEWESRLVAESQERERLAATLDMERKFAELSAYRSARVDQERENILPELIDLIAGNTQEDIEQSIVSLRSRTEAILGNVQLATQVARQDMRGASVTAPPVGPLETQSSTQTLTPEDIRNMDINVYAQHRDRLLGAVRNNVQQKGLYG
jgi:hypothetical protein